MFFKGFVGDQLLETGIMRHISWRRWVCLGVVPGCQLQKHLFLCVSGVQKMDNQAEREIRGLVHRLLMVLHLHAVEGKPR